MRNYHELGFEAKMRQKAIQQEIRAIRLAQAAAPRRQRVPLACYSLFQRIIALFNFWRQSSIRVDRPVAAATDPAVPCP